MTSFVWGIVATLLLVALLGWMPAARPDSVGASVPVEATSSSNVVPGRSSVDPLSAVEPTGDQEEQLFVDLYRQTSPSVVYIAVTTANGSGSGSGFVFDREGHIVTNNHVVEDARRVLVSFVDGTTAEATLVGTDADSDLAVIQVDVDPDLLEPVTLGDSAALQVGQRAIAIGNPFGLEQTMTTGIISALGRVLRQESGFSLPELVQTDAAINPGNSGGPLLDSAGQVVGVTTLIYSSSGSNAGVGFAVPVNTVKRVVPALIETGRYADPWLGIQGVSVSEILAEALELPVSQGVLVQNVVSGGPAEMAGLQAGDRFVSYEGEQLTADGDIIVAIGDLPVEDMDDLIVYLADLEVGQTVDLTVVRDGIERTIPITLAERPAS